jgi:hypothetical protein
VFTDSSRAELLEPLPWALASGLVGAAIWRYHQLRLVPASSGHRVARLVLAGVGLIIAVSGIGVIVNVALASLTSSIVGGSRVDLLHGGLTALMVGTPVWWSRWQPTRPPSIEEVASKSRRAYLLVGFGLAGVVALTTSLFVAYRIFEVALDARPGGLVEAIRAPLGVLLATGIAATYHFPIWRQSRAEEHTRPRIGHVVLVTAADPGPLRKAIADQTGAKVTVWHRADVSDSVPSVEHLTDALASIVADRVMVVTGPGAHLDVIPLR